MPIFYRVVVFLFCALAYTCVRAQDFSYEQFAQETSPEKRLRAGIDAWNYYIKNNVDSLKIIGFQLLPAEKISKRDRQLYAVGTRNLGSYFVRTNGIKKGIGLLNEAKKEFAKQELVVLLSETENELGNAYFLMGNYRLAAEHFLASMKIGQETADETAGFNGMIGFGKAICADGDTAKGIRLVEQFLSKCLTLKKFESASDACGFLGSIAGEQNKLELMSAYYNRGIRYAKISGSLTHQANALNNKAIDFYVNDQLDSTMVYFTRALELRIKVGTISPIVESKYNIAIMHLENGDFPLAKQLAEEGELIAHGGGIRSWQLDCLRLLQEIAIEMNDQTEKGKLDREIKRLETELKNMGHIDNEVLNAAMSYASGERKNEGANDILWQIIGISALFLSVFLLFKKEFAA